MLASSSVTFTSDETVAYTPDTEENQEGFDVEVVEDPIPELELKPIEIDEKDDDHRKNRATRKLLLAAGGVLVLTAAFTIVYVLCRKKNNGSVDDEIKSQQSVSKKYMT